MNAEPPPQPPPAVCVPHVRAARRSGFSAGLLWGLLALVIAVTIVSVMWWAWARRPLVLVLVTAAERTATLRPQSHKPMRLAALPADDAQTQTRCVLAPMVYSEQDEGFVIRMRLGVDNVLVVLDSGSANLAVGTASCIKDALCSAHDGAYRAGASPHAIALGTSAKLEYASLSVDAELWHDVAAFPAVPPGRCAAAPPALEHVHTEVAVPSLVPIAAANAMDGTAGNILGLMGAWDGAAEQPVLETLLTALDVPRRWTMACGARGGGWFALGDLPDACGETLGPVKYVPMARGWGYMGAPCVEIEAVRYRSPATNGAWRTLAAGEAPRYAVLDTGTSETYVTAVCAPAFHDVMGLPRTDARVAKTALAGLPDIEIHIAGGVRVQYGAGHYMAPVRSQAGAVAYRTTLHSSNDTVARLFGDARVLLVGVNAMMGACISVDLEQRRVGFAAFADGK